MAVGKNKRLLKSKKGGKKKTADPFTRKEWYDIKAPAIFTTRLCGKTPVTRTTGTKIASDSLKGRVFEVSLGDLNKESQDQDFRKMKLVGEEVQGKNVLCNFYGMDFTRDKLASLIRKWHSLIEASVDLRTTDGYVLRFFTIAFTDRRKNQIAKTSYAKASQVRAIRKKMVDILTTEVTKSDLKGVFQKLVAESIGAAIQKACFGIYPITNVFVRKVKMIKAPKFDLTRLMEVQGETGEDAGKKVERADEQPAVESLVGSGGRL